MASLFGNQGFAFLFIVSLPIAVTYSYCDRYSTTCDSDEVCCAHNCVYGSTCLDQFCTYDSDCSTGESCCNSKCVYGSTCLYQFCTDDSDCSSGESCCNSQCRPGFDCSGYSCSFSSDCSIGQSCCNAVCTDTYDCEDPTPVIIGSVLGSLIIFFLVLSLIYCLCRRRRLVGSGRVIEGGRVTTTIATTAPSVVHVPPEGYQQSYPYYPPPQYNQYQNSAAPPYSDRATQGSDLPPPYPTTYGAVQTSPS
ncbi:keratin-associated protein 10-6-like [Montipora capricornis]|uniref:keratin-associated protein 10-6-like n=1 Tax=Montipora capricornis TaxID=246305 RepID=UPI0035F20E9D